MSVSRGKKKALTDEEKVLEEIRNAIKESQESRDRRLKKETVKLKTPYGQYTKSTNAAIRVVDTRTQAEIHESRRRLYHAHEELKSETLNLAAVDHQLRKYAFDMANGYHKLDQTERGKKKVLERFVPALYKVDAQVGLSKSQSMPSSSSSSMVVARKNRSSPVKAGKNVKADGKPPPPPSAPSPSLAELAASNKKVNFHITSTRMKRKYPQFCMELTFTDDDVKGLSCKRDNWIVKFMELCYDEALEAFGTATTHGKRKLHHGLDIGGLESFPSLVQRVIAQQFSTLELRTKTSLELLYTIEYLMQTAEVSRYKMKFDEAKILFDGGRALLFSRFLTEEYDVDVLAAFLYCRDLVQQELGHKLKDVNPIRMRLDIALLELKPTFNTLLEQTKVSVSSKTPGKLSKLMTRLPPRSIDRTPPPPPSGSLPSPSMMGSMSAHQKSSKSTPYKLAPEFQDTVVAPANMFDDDCKVVPLKLPDKWSYVDDVALPETPLVAFENKNVMHLCFVISAKAEESARQYLCRRIKDVAVKDMLREGTYEAKAQALTHIHIYAFLRAVCAEWKRISAEDKGQFTDTGSLLTNLTSLNEIYDNNCALIKDTAEKVLLAEGALSLAAAKVSRLEKQLKREEKRFDSRLARQEDTDKLTQFREELTVAKLDKMDCEEALVQLKRDKQQLEVKVEKLWANITDGKRSMKYDTSPGAGSFWRQFVSFMLSHTLQSNAKEYAITQQSASNAAGVIQDAMASTAGTRTSAPPTKSTTVTLPTASAAATTTGPTDEEVRYSLIEVLARIVARNAINDGKRKVLLRDFLAQKRHDLLLRYGDEEAHRQQQERLRLLREERARQERHRVTVFMVKAMSPSIVQPAIDVAKARALQALYDPWWMLDLDPVKFVPATRLAEVETRYIHARRQRRVWLLRILYRVLARPVYMARIADAHSRWQSWRALRKWHLLHDLNQRSQMLTSRVQRLARCFLFKCRLRRHLHRLRLAEINADEQRRRFCTETRFPRMMRYWHVYATLRRRYRETRAALSERRFLICFYTWLDKFKKLRLAQMQRSKRHHDAAWRIQMCVRRFLARRCVQRKRAIRRLHAFARIAMARQRLWALRQSRRQRAELEGYVRYRQEKCLQRRSLALWRRSKRILDGCYGLQSAYVHDKLRQRWIRWRAFTAARNAYLGAFVVKIQSLFHMAVVFRRYWHFYRWRRAFVKLQGLVRRYQAIQRYVYDIYYYRKAKTIQRYARGYIIRKTIDQRRLGDVMYAASHNKYERLKFYVDHRPDLVSKVDHLGNTALHYAAQQASKRTLKLLMRFGLQPNVLNHAGFSPLHLLIMSSAIHRDECFIYMIERGFDEDQLTSTGKTCLLLAAEQGHVVIVKRLLEDGHDPNVADETGWTCLQAGCASGSAPVVRELLENDAEPNRAGRNGTYPVHESVTGANLEVLNLLLTYRAEVNVTEPNYWQTPLMWAAQMGHGDFARQLILYGGEVNARDSAGKTAAHYAAMTNTTDIYHALREAEADFDITDNEGNTPLHMAAFYNSFSFAQEVLQGGAYPSFQNDQGDQPAHIAARYNQLDMLKVIAQYDEHIGRCNYAHQTPLGVAKFHQAWECAQFLEKHYFLVETVDGRNAVGEIWWDKTIDETLLDWNVQVQANGDRFYVNRKTGAVTDRPPAMAATTVKKIAEKAELPVQRAITLVKEGTALTKHAYYLEYQEQQAEIKDMNKDYRHATCIVKWARRKLAYMALRRLRAQRKRNRTILRFLKRHLPGFMRYRNELKRVAALRIQAAWRGYVMRKTFFAPYVGEYWELRRRLAHRRLRFDLWAMWQAYKRKMAFRALLLIAKMPRTLADWALIIDKAKRPIRSVGAYEEWLYPGQRNVYFYRHALTGNCEFTKPLKLIVHDDEAQAEALQRKKFGATLKQIALVTKLQALWRGYQVRHYSRSVEKALRLCQEAEMKYLNQPEVDNHVYNFALYSLTFRQDIDRARRLFVESLRRMQWRGPDIAFVLYAYAIFGMLSDDEDYVDVKKLIVRAREAEDYHHRLVRAKYLAEEKAMNYDYVAPTSTVGGGVSAYGGAANDEKSKQKQLAAAKKKKKQQKKKQDAAKNNDGSNMMLLLTNGTGMDGDDSDDEEGQATSHYGRCFDLAHVGFFRYTATTVNNAMAWEGLAICRFLVYNDFKTSFDAFLEAFKFEPKNQRIRRHFDVMMRHFYGDNRELHDEMTKVRLRQLAQEDADREEMRRIARERAKQRWEAASRIKRWYKERRQQRVFHAFLTLVREKIRRLGLSRSRGPTPAGTDGSRPDSRGKYARGRR